MNKHWILTLSDEGISVPLVSHDMGLMDVAACVQVLSLRVADQNTK
jgi:hypothetical protein